MTAPLGAATVHLVERLRRKHGEYGGGAVVTYTGCSVQPQGSTEDDNGLTTEARWVLWAPGGDFPTATKNVVRWNGLDLQIDGELQTWFDDLTGVALYVTGRLKRWQA